MMYVNGHLYPIGAGAIKGLTERIKTSSENWDMLKNSSPQSLSENLNNDMRALGKKLKNRPYLTVLVQDEKIRAVNSGRYAACPATVVMKAVNEWVKKQYPQAFFVKGYANHDFAAWHLDLSYYTDDVLMNFPELKSNGFTPALTIMLSHTGDSSVSFKPALKIDKMIFPVGEGINAPHIAKGTFSERALAMEDAVKKNLDAVFPKLSEVTEKIDTLRNVQVSNAYNALLRGMKSLGLPKKQAKEAAEQFKALYGEYATAYEIYLSVVDTMAFVIRDFPKDYRKQFAVAKAMERAVVGINWEKLGTIPGEFLW